MVSKMGLVSFSMNRNVIINSSLEVTDHQLNTFASRMEEVSGTR